MFRLAPSDVPIRFRRYRGCGASFDTHGGTDRNFHDLFDNRTVVQPTSPHRDRLACGGSLPAFWISRLGSPVLILPMQDERPSKRARNATACTRCKHRKQRCDNDYPACSACSSAGETCHYENRVYRAQHVETLEKRVLDLEHQLRQARQQHQNAPPAIGSSAATANVPAVSMAISHHENGEADAAFDMLSSNSYLGTSSGFPLARTLQAAIGPSSISPARPSEKHGPNLVKPASPDNPMGLRFVDTYLRKVHPKHPFLHPRRIYELHRSCQTLASSARPIADSPLPSRIDFLVLHLIYAVGARYMQLSQTGFHCNPEVSICVGLSYKRYD